MIDLELIIGTIYYDVVLLTSGEEKVIYNLPYIVASILVINAVWWMFKYISQIISIAGGRK